MFLLQALGSNGSGQLGLGHQDDVSTPQPVTLPSSLTTAGIKPTQIAAGGNHTLLLLSSGTLLSAGDTASGACGRLLPPSSSPTTVSPSFHPVDLPSPLFLTDGDGGGGGDTKITHIAATWEASVLVVTTTTSSTTGSNTSSTTSNTTTTSINPPTKTSKVYTFGTGSKGELGLGPGTPHTSTPTAIPNFPPAGTHVVDLAACMGHAVAVLSNGEAWGWGSGRKGQLGTLPAPAGATGGVVWAPRRIEGVGFAVARAVCGREFTCLFGGRETGEMVVLGSDKWGVRTRAPAAGVLAGWREVGAGWGSVFVLRADGRLVSWGRDDHGQMAPEDLGPVRRVAVGSEHALALTEAGDVVAWGWGEHGNCGPIRQCEGEKGQRNRIAAAGEGTEITMIGAGCATTWLVTEGESA